MVAAEPRVLLTRDRVRSANRGMSALMAGSLALHAALIGAIAVASARTPKEETRTVIPVELVTLGAPRDPKLLPRKVRSAPPAPAPAAAAPSKDAVALEGKAPTRSPPTKRSPQLSDAAQKLLETHSDARLEEALGKLEAPEGSPDGSRFGTTTDPAAIADAYEAEVKGILQANYRLPDTVPVSQRRFLEAEVALYIDARGRVARFEFLRRHENATFMNALEALLRTVELPPPPAHLAKTYASGGLAIRFTP